MVTPGATAELVHTVGAADTATAVGSGDLPVLGTPRLVAWFEAATCAAVDGTLGEGMTSVGIRVDVRHEAPSPVGAAVRVRATLATVDGRRLTFEVRAEHVDGEVVGRGVVERVVVDAERFMGRLG